jgi:uncharacterized membrane protein YtjA (UPF0391 family)
MLTWALAFLIIAVIAGLFGFRGVEVTAASIAQLIFFVFIVLLVISLLFGTVLYPTAAAALFKKAAWTTPKARTASGANRERKGSRASKTARKNLLISRLIDAEIITWRKDNTFECSES